MRAIRKVAATQRAVICTIHQPSTYLFDMFDALLLLKKGGQVVFLGPLGDNSSNLISYLQSIRSTVPIRDHVNPAKWMLEVIGAGTTGKNNPQIFADFYKKSKLRSTSMAKVAPTVSDISRPVASTSPRTPLRVLWAPFPSWSLLA
ncbi:unnamed protein product [Ectocarpus sp. 13 AM-2016]